LTRTHRAHQSYEEDQRAFFDSLVTEDWDAYQSDVWDRAREFEVEELLRRAPAQRVIDVGCGVGYHDLVMARDHGVTEVLAIDYSPRSIEVARSNYSHPAVRHEVADVFELEPGDFDLAVSFQVIEHLSNPAEFLEACARQVRPGGTIAVFTPNRLRLNNRILLLRRRTPELADPQHFREYTRAELRDLGASVGLRAVAGFGYGLSLLVPKLDRDLVRGPGLRLGRLAPALAEGLCEIFVNEGTSG
jgi:SAM-dependent methyltransferase